MNGYRLLSVTVRKLVPLLLLALSACVTSPPLTVAPDTGRGPAVILLSGASGPYAYRPFADAVTKLGYVALLVDGNSVARRKPDAPEKLQKLIADVQRDPRVSPGKVAIIGFSLGGGTALVYGATYSEAVSAVVAFYPAITGHKNIPEAAAKVSVPTLLLAGEQDRYHNCCLIESMREFESAARGAKALVTLVSYPSADHGFNISAYKYRSEDAADAWERTKSFLLKHHPLP